MDVRAELRQAIADAHKAVLLGDLAGARRIAAAAPAGRQPSRNLARIEPLCLAREERHDEAARAWCAFDGAFGLNGGDWLRYGRALEQCGEIAGALAAYRSLPVRPGLEQRGALAEGSLHFRLGHLASALGVMDAAVQASAGSPLEIKARRVRASYALQAGRLSDALGDHAVISALDPQDPAGLFGQIEIHLADRDAASAATMLALAARTHPGHPTLLTLEAGLVSQRGTDADLVAFAYRLAGAALPGDQAARVLSALFGARRAYFGAALRACLLDGLGDGPAGAVAAKMLAARDRQDPHALLDDARKAVAAHRRFPDSPAAIRARVDLARQLVAVGEAGQAHEVIDALREATRDWPYAPPIIGPVAEWQAVCRGAVADAQQSYWARRNMVAGQDRRHELECLRRLPDPPPSVVVFCQLRNELPVLPAFFRHYRGIGVARFVMIDNDSSDGSLEWLRAQPDVELYATRAPFRRSGSGNHWTNPLIARAAYAQTLCLRVDADEHLVYPHCETRPIAALWRYMRAEGAEVLAGYLLDMLPRTLAALDEAGADFTAAARFFDPPPEPRPDISCPYSLYFGGPRTRLFGSLSQSLTKSSGLRGGGTVEQVSASHRASPARVSSVGMVLLHYKFRPDLFARADRIAAEHEYSAASQEYTRYRALHESGDAPLVGDAACEYSGSGSLLRQGALRSTAAWDAQADDAQAEDARAPILLTWARGDIVAENWGDKLNPRLVELLAGRAVRHVADVRTAAKRDQPVYSVIGSHLARLTGQHTVWGTGFIAADDRIAGRPRAVLSVRGPLSRAMLLAQGIDCPEVYGDPAVLLPLLYRPDVSKSHDLGIIAHVRDRRVVGLSATATGLRLKEIDITGDLYAVVDDISRCRAIATSSLHGLIAAHAYGVPAIWVTFGDRLKGDGLKFRDYLASVGLSGAEPYPAGPETTAEELAGRVRLPGSGIDLQKLIDACPFIDDRRKGDLIALAATLRPAA